MFPLVTWPPAHVSLPRTPGWSPCNSCTWSCAPSSPSSGRRYYSRRPDHNLHKAGDCPGPHTPHTRTWLTLTVSTLRKKSTAELRSARQAARTFKWSADLCRFFSLIIKWWQHAVLIILQGGWTEFCLTLYLQTRVKNKTGTVETIAVNSPPPC